MSGDRLLTSMHRSWRQGRSRCAAAADAVLPYRERSAGKARVLADDRDRARWAKFCVHVSCGGEYEPSSISVTMAAWVAMGTGTWFRDHRRRWSGVLAARRRHGGNAAHCAKAATVCAGRVGIAACESTGICAGQVGIPSRESTDAGAGHRGIAACESVGVRARQAGIPGRRPTGLCVPASAVP